MVLTGFVFFVILVASGAMIKHGKQHWLIAGYNTLPPEKQKQVDTAGLANFIGHSFFGLGAFVLAGSLITSRWYPNLFPYVLILCTAGIILVGLGAQKYDRNRKSGREKAVLIAVLALGALVLIAAVGLTLYGSRSAPVEIKPEGIIIGGIYGTIIPWKEITGIELKGEIPKVISRNNGFSSGEVHKGHFTLEGLGRGRLYLESKQGPFISIFTRESYVIINYKDPLRTEALFVSLASRAKFPESLDRSCYARYNLLGVKLYVQGSISRSAARLAGILLKKTRQEFLEALKERTAHDGR